MLAALVAGLLASPLPPLTLVLAAALTAIGGRPRLAGVCALAVLAGAWWAQARVAALDRSRLAPLMGEEVEVAAAVLEPPRRARSGAGWALASIFAGPGRGERMLLRAGRDVVWPQLRSGEVVRVAGRLARLGPHDSHHRRRGAHAVLFVSGLERTGHRRGGAAGAMDRLQDSAQAAVTAGLDRPRAALALGMVLGRDERLSERVRGEFRDSGLAHLLAASGQNVMLLAALAVGLLGALGAGLRARMLGALVLIALYVPLAGAGPSIQRAAVMGAAAIAATLAGRPASRWYALLLAAAVTLLASPRAASDPGWQLSFAAVVAIVALASTLRLRLTARGVPRPAAEAAAMSLAATLGTAPLLAFHFGRLSLVSLPANLLAVPAVAPVMWLGMLAAGSEPIAPGAAAAINAVARFPLAYLGWLAHAAAAAPAAAVPLRIPSSGLLVGAYSLVGLLAWAMVRAPARHRRRLRAALLGAGLAAAAAVGSGLRPAPGPDPRTLVVSFLDVGQGDATLVQHAGATVLVDTGPPDGPVLARLREAGVRRIDLLVVTHAQADHEGRAAAVLERHPVGLLLDGGDGAGTREHRQIVATARRRGVRRLTPDAGQVLRIGPMTIDVLWPRREPPELHAGEDPNRRAVVAHLRDGDFDLLLPADAESEVTAPLKLPAAEALKVAHHGSADPGLADLLARVRPRLAVIEVGRRNRHGHPTAQALSALRSVPAVYRTDRDGTVRLAVSAGRMAVTTAG